MTRWTWIENARRTRPEIGGRARGETGTRLEMGVWCGLLAGLLAASGPAAASNAARADGRGAGGLMVAAVRDARAVALDRIEEREQCRELFEEHGADGAQLLESAVYWRAEPGEAGGLCERGAAAFTGMRSGRTALCADSFLKLGRHYGAVVLIHEALHVAGLGQHPHHPGAETPQEIDRRVRRSCGL